MSRFIGRHTLANISKLVNRSVSVSSKSGQCLERACLASVSRSFPAVMQCSARNYTYSDHEFTKCLDKEILLEETYIDKVDDKVGMFTVVKKDGADVEFKGSYEDEEIKIKTNMNGILVSSEDEQPDIDPDEQENENEPDVQFVPKPTFTIEITKKRKETLLIQATVANMESPDDHSLEIQMFTIVKKGTELNDSTFTCYAEDMDENIHNFLVGLLAKRGFNSEFLAELQFWVENYERSLYQNLLKDMKEWISK